MSFKLTTYKTMAGEKKIARYNGKVSGKWIIYENKKPTYQLDCFDLNSKSGLLLNDLLFSEKKTIKQIIEAVNKKHKKKLSIEKPPIIEIIKETIITEIELLSFPHEWLK
jgi:hypothetical protein